LFKAKTGSNQFGSVFSSFFCLGSVWFFRFQVYKTETEPVGFFKILIGLIGFFHGSVFSVIFFSGFLGLIDFLIFLNTPSYKSYTMF
jgi:hypothetical protein